MQNQFTNRGKLGGVLPRSDFPRVSIISAAGILLLLSIASSLLAAGPRVDIVIGEKAPALEKRAAEDIAFDLKKVYDAEVKIATAAPEGAENVFFVGSPETNEATKKQIAESWPLLSEQGQVLRTIKYRGKSALFVGGGSPRATYWAAAEYAHRLGIRSMLYGDLYPVSPPAFSAEKYDISIEPGKGYRPWQINDPLPTGQWSWGLEDQKKLLRQLARLKFTQLEIDVRAWQPFVHFEFEGVKKQTGVLWYGWQFPVSGDTAGRAAFKGAKLFENPDFAGAKTYEQRLATGKKLFRGLLEEANSLGMPVDITIDYIELPKEFADFVPEVVPSPEPEKLVVFMASNRDEKLIRLAKTQGFAYQKAYPEITQIGLVSHRTDLPPQSLVTDANFSAYALSRHPYDANLTPESTCRDFVTAVCGDGVDGSVLKAHGQLKAADSLIKGNDPKFTIMIPNMILKHYASTEPPPEWWSKVRDNYLGAMNDMYRANSRAREGGRSYTLYLARRCEFGYEYMNCVEATRKAGIAKGKKDTAEQRAQLEKAIESMNAACSALAAVARDQSDRGMIAVCNEFGYKALQKELEKLEAE